MAVIKVMHIPSECLLVCAKLEWVEAVVSGKVACKVLGSTSTGQPESPLWTAAGDPSCLCVNACADSLRTKSR